ncbi:MAG: glycosyltransferase family 9 protein [Myxococcota bacterium]
MADVIAYGQAPLPARAAKIIDLHASPRSRWVSLQIRGPTRRIRRHDLRRRMRVILKVGAPPPSMVQRYGRAADVEPAPWPFLTVARRSPDALLLCPGAAHRTKRWPVDRFIALGQRWKGPVLVLGGPDEIPMARTIVDGVGPKAEALAERGFERTAVALKRGAVAVGGDTGLMHLCAAAGVRTVTLFGPTTAADGYWSSPGERLGHPLPCRPCSRHGRPDCPFGDHLCMDALSVDTVWAAVAP